MHTGVNDLTQRVLNAPFTLDLAIIEHLIRHPQVPLTDKTQLLRLIYAHATESDAYAVSSGARDIISYL